MRDQTLRMSAREWLFLVILSVLWGGSFFFFKVLAAEFPPFTVVLGRVGLAAAALNIFLLAKRDPLFAAPRLWGSFLVMGLLNNVVPFTLVVFGETRIPSGSASILNATTPVFTVLAAHALTANERLTWAKGAGVTFGLVGVVVLIGPDAVSGIGRENAVGQTACVLAAAVYSIAAIFGRRFRGLAPLKVATGQTTASTVILIPITLAVDRPWLLNAPSAQAWAAWLCIALLSTALAYMIYFRVLAAAGAINVSLVTLLVPVSALVLGAAFLGEMVTLQSLAGMVLIGLGLATIDGRPLNLVRRLWRETPQSSA